MSVGKSSIARAARTVQHPEPEKPVARPAESAVLTQADPATIRLLPDDSRVPVPSEALLQSVRTVGILEPLPAAETDGTCYLIGGHRRWAAALALHLPTVPVVLRFVPDLAAAQALADALRAFAVPDLQETKFRAVSAIQSDLPPYLL